MQNDVDILRLIVKSCGDILSDIDIFGNDAEDYITNGTFQRSTSFSLSQIGEYTKKLSSEIKNKYPEMEWKKIAGLRDIINHNYMHIDKDELWVTITKEVPSLKEYCEMILSKES